MRRASLVAPLSFVAALALAGCPFAEHGRVRSSRPVAGEVTPAKPREASCGSVREARRSSLVRAPYVQDVREDRAIVRWSSRAPSDERLVVRTLDGEERGAPETDRTDGDHAFRAERRARVLGLEPASTYCYELRSAAGELLYGAVALRTAPLRSSAGPVDAIVLGDSGGGGDDQRAVRDRMRAVPAELILHVGDLAYPAASTGSLDDRVFEMYEPLLRTIPIYPALGNHDVREDGGRSWREAFELPEEPSYSLDRGPLHVAVLDTTGDLRAQAEWLDQDLAASEAPFEIVVGHHPARSSGWHGVHRAMQEHVVPVLVRHRVRLAIAGHDHHYERTREIDGVTYVVTGGGGHSVRSFAPSADTLVSEAVFHFVHLRVTDRALELRAIDATGVVFDAWRVER